MSVVTKLLLKSEEVQKISKISSLFEEVTVTISDTKLKIYGLSIDKRLLLLFDLPILGGMNTSFGLRSERLTKILNALSDEVELFIDEGSYISLKSKKNLFKLRPIKEQEQKTIPELPYTCNITTNIARLKELLSNASIVGYKIKFEDGKKFSVQGDVEYMEEYLESGFEGTGTATFPVEILTKVFNTLTKSSKDQTQVKIEYGNDLPMKISIPDFHVEMFVPAWIDNKR